MGKKIVVIDDDPVVRMLMSECLALHGYEVKAHESGAAGLSWLTSNTPDIVFVDLIMPDMTGLELIKKVRELPENKALPIVLLSANADRKFTQVDECMRPNRVLEKPWDLKVLIEVLEELTSS